MNTNKTLYILLITIIVFISCVKDDDFSIPKSKADEQNKALIAVLDSIKKGEITEISITQLKNDFFRTRRAKQVKGNYLVKGYVTSSDESGNFYKEFYIQDKPENPTSGIKIALNLTNSYNHFNIGREVYIRLKGLYIGETRGGDNDITIGGFVKKGKTELEPISENQLKKQHHILRSAKTDTIVPLPITFSKINKAHLGIFVKVDNVSFEEKGQSYFNPKKDYETERKMISCENTQKGEFYLETSSFANFGAKLLPLGGGSIAGVIVKDYDRNLRMAINNTNDVKMDSEVCVVNETEKMPISELKALFKKNTVTISEDKTIKVIVTSDKSNQNITDKNAFVQDETAGISLNFDTPHDLNLGDEIEISLRNLQLTKTNGLLQLNLSSSNIIKKVKGKLPTPKTITIAQALTGNYESELVKIENVQFKNITKNYAGHNTITSNCTDELTIFVNNKAVFSNEKVSNKKGTITGIVSNNNGIQLYIRNTSDINFTKNYTCKTVTKGKKVSDVKALFKGNTVTILEDATIKVIVTSDKSKQNITDKNAFVQDETAGISLNFTTTHDLNLGDEIEIALKNLKLTKANGLLQLNLSNSNILKKGKGKLPTPKTVTIAQALTGNYESELVKIENVQFKNITKNYIGKNTITSNCTDELTIFVNNKAVFSNEKVNNKKGTITGIVSNNNGIQLYIRSTSDINFTKNYTCKTVTKGKKVSDIRALFKGNTVTILEDATIKVIVTSDKSKQNITDKNAFVQDETAGISLNFTTPHDLNLGDEIEIALKNLKLTKANGLLQLNLSNSNIIKKEKGKLPTPKTITIAQALTGNYESELVKIENVQFKNITKNYTGNNTITSNCTDELTMFVNNKAVFSNEKVSDKKGTITGVVSNNNGIQLYIRNTSDINFVGAYTCGNSNTTTSDLFFSEYVEGSSYNKYIEIYNGTNTDINLSNYKVELYGNGSAVPTKKLDLSTITNKTLKKGAVLILYNSRANATIKNSGGISSSVTGFNGDDAIALKKGNTIIDVIGKIGEKPKDGWNVAGVSKATKDHSLIRKPNITKGITDWAKSAGTNASNSEWIVKAKDDFSSLGKR